MKKIFIKFARLLGYEIIDQNNFVSPTLNKDLTILKGKVIFFRILLILMLLCSPLIGNKVWSRSFTGKTFDSNPNLEPIK